VPARSNLHSDPVSSDGGELSTKVLGRGGPPRRILLEAPQNERIELDRNIQDERGERFGLS